MLLTKLFQLPLISIVFFCPFNISQWELEMGTGYFSQYLIFYSAEVTNAYRFVKQITGGWINYDRASILCGPSFIYTNLHISQR